MLRIAHLNARYDGRPALQDINLQLDKGELLVALGPSGCGKTTLLNLIAGFLPVESGSITLEGKTISGPGAERGVVFQHEGLLPWRNVLDNVAFGLQLAGMARGERNAIARRLIKKVGLEGAENRPIWQLSGGQRQRVGIARALAASPALLLCDEATSALDPETTRSILALLKSLNQRLGITILLITHEMEVIKSVAHRVAVIDAGEIIEQGPVWQLFAHPQAQLTRTLLRGLLPQLPDNIAARLSQQKQGEVIYNVHFAGQEAQGELLTRFACALPGAFRLIQGGVDHIQHYAVVRFFIAIPASNSADEQRVLAWLQQQQAQVEKVGYVASDD